MIRIPVTEVQHPKDKVKRLHEQLAALRTVAAQFDDPDDNVLLDILDGMLDLLTGLI